MYDYYGRKSRRKQCVFEIISHIMYGTMETLYYFYVFFFFILFFLNMVPCGFSGTIELSLS